MGFFAQAPHQRRVCSVHVRGLIRRRRRGSFLPGRRRCLFRKYNASQQMAARAGHRCTRSVIHPLPADATNAERSHPRIGGLHVTGSGQGYALVDQVKARPGYPGAGHGSRRHRPSGNRPSVPIIDLILPGRITSHWLINSPPDQGSPLPNRCSGCSKSVGCWLGLLEPRLYPCNTQQEPRLDLRYRPRPV